MRNILLVDGKVVRIVEDDSEEKAKNIFLDTKRRVDAKNVVYTDDNIIIYESNPGSQQWKSLKTKLMTMIFIPWLKIHDVVLWSRS